MIVDSIGAFSIVLFNIILWTLTIAKSKLSPLAKDYFQWSFYITGWSLGYGFTLSGLFDYDTTLVWNKLCQAMAVMIGPHFFKFACHLSDEFKRYKHIYRIYLLFGIASALLLFFTPYYVRGLWSFGGYKYQPSGGPLYIVFTAFFFWCTIHAFMIAATAYKNLSGEKKKQVRLFLWGTGIGYSGGVFLFLQGFHIPFPSHAVYLILAYLIFIGYAMHKYRFLDVELILKRTVVFTGLVGFIFITVALATLILQDILFRHIAINRIWLNMISFSVIVLLYDAVKSCLVKVTNRFLFQKKYEYKQILKAFIDEVITVLNLDEVVNSTLKLLDATLHPYTSGIFILNKVEDKYQLYNAYGLENKNITFTSESELVTFLKKSHSPAVIRQIDGIVGVSPEIQQEMATLKAVICLPLMLHNDLIGFISLGKKKSDEDYTKDDLDVLLDLSRTESIAVGNAQLLTEAAQNERRAAIGTMAAGINHEIGNPLNIINTKIQVFLTGIERGFYKDKSKEEIIQECKNIVNDALVQTNRIADITRRLSNFAKPSKEFKPQLVSIPEEIDETLAVLGHDLELERIKIERNISSDLPKILADRREIQQIFFNIIRNAAQAIEEKGTITISGVNTSNNKVHIEIRDTGKGIPEDKVHRIFEPFFTTKEPAKGTGLGLSIVRQLVWRNKGEISFRSQSGLGTTFILEFPKGT